MKTLTRAILALLFSLTCPVLLLAAEPKAADATDKTPSVTPAQNKACADCHRKNSPALVMEWERSVHSQRGVGCLDCHGSEKTKTGSWLHEGSYVSVLVTPKDCCAMSRAGIQGILPQPPCPRGRDPRQPGQRAG